MSLNVVVLMGRITKDPELKYTPSNVAVTSFTIAADRRYQDGNKQVDLYPSLHGVTQLNLSVSTLTKAK